VQCHRFLPASAGLARPPFSRHVTSRHATSRHVTSRHARHHAEAPRPRWPDGGFVRAQQGWAGRPGAPQGPGSARSPPPSVLGGGAGRGSRLHGGWAWTLGSRSEGRGQQSGSRGRAPGPPADPWGQARPRPAPHGARSGFPDLFECKFLNCSPMSLCISLVFAVRFPFVF
jgi:hypothetical protein